VDREKLSENLAFEQTVMKRRSEVIENTREEDIRQREWVLR
jgi:hypothetical protein